MSLYVYIYIIFLGWELPKIDGSLLAGTGTAAAKEDFPAAEPFEGTDFDGAIGAAAARDWLARKSTIEFDDFPTNTSIHSGAMFNVWLPEAKSSRFIGDIAWYNH